MLTESFSNCTCHSEPKPKLTNILDTEDGRVGLTNLLKKAEADGYENSLKHGKITKWLRDKHEFLFDEVQRGPFHMFQKCGTESFRKKINHARKTIVSTHFSQGAHCGEETGAEGEHQLPPHAEEYNKFLLWKEHNPTNTELERRQRDSRRQQQRQVIGVQPSLGPTSEAQETRTEVSQSTVGPNQHMATRNLSSNSSSGVVVEEIAHETVATSATNARSSQANVSSLSSTAAIVQTGGHARGGQRRPQTISRRRNKKGGGNKGGSGRDCSASGLSGLTQQMNDAHTNFANLLSSTLSAPPVRPILTILSEFDQVYAKYKAAKDAGDKTMQDMYHKGLGRLQAEIDSVSGGEQKDGDNGTLQLN